LSNFSDLGLSPEILQVLPELGLDTPTKIQLEAIPILLASKEDFIGLAQTGTGKTAAFGLPIIDLVEKDWNVTQAIVLAPTRELVQQIASQLQQFSKYYKQLNVVAVYGGAPIMGQIKDLKKKCQIVVATPGRCIDLIGRKALKLENISHVILDEADEMLNMGFKEELNKILAFTPKDKRTWLFSATMPKAIKNIVHEYMHDPKEISVTAGVQVNENISHKYVMLKSTDKTEAIKRFMDQHADFYGIIFCRTKMDTVSLADELSKEGYSADALNGDLTQNQRDHVMKKFKAMKLRALVATDVAARGIDVNNVTHVIHHRLPDEMEFYTHRSGRTARAGKKGISLTLATKADLKKLKFLEQKLKINFEKDVVPSATNIRSNKIEQWADSVASITVSNDISKSDWEVVQEKFLDLDKDTLIQKLVSKELLALSGSSGTKDLNESEGKSVRKQGNSNEQRFFINLGELDGMDEEGLTKLITETTGIKESSISDMTVLTKCSYYTVPSDQASKISGTLDGLDLDGREVRSNPDDDGQPSSGKKRGDGDRRDSRGGGGYGSGGYGGGNRGGGDRRRGTSNSSGGGGSGAPRKGRRRF
jgi:ATP-dependent RNA helicase DeaD